MVNAKEIIERLLELEKILLGAKVCAASKQVCDSVNSGLIMLKYCYPQKFDYTLEARLRSYYSHFGYTGASCS